ncbi:uncharacterized protein DUF4345 [Shimia isoporae]|uniref:Uncharacterized protein DUF4345 n=1 Tax=Shimia isoporae TaxID=647720 RepID=A0A4R1N687_9RHOB|nr:DUF4345 domain-containing protein [Shimia isoporae]TCL01612.1 uncharacterized protein DUF4345 [Shimia isoporae]
MKSTLLLRGLIALIGFAIAFLGLDVVFGGIRTLGWMGPTDFVEVVNPTDFAVQDNHVRFLGGVFSGIGLLFVLGAVAFSRMRTAIMVLCALVFIGGLSRFTTPDFGTLFNMAVLPSLLAELILFPLVGFWVYKAGKSQ